MLEKTEGQSRMDNPETLRTLGTHYTGQKQTKYNTTQKTKKTIDFWCLTQLSAISRRPVLVVEEAGENHRPWASNW
jgi:hypothetical protein